MTAAAADTSSEVAKKKKDAFLKETSRLIVRLLDPYRKTEGVRGKIHTNEDFKHLAKKVRQLKSLFLKRFLRNLRP